MAAYRSVLVNIVETRFPLLREMAKMRADQLNKPDILNVLIAQISVAPDEKVAREALETAQNSLKLDFERQQKRLTRFEKQTNDQLTDLKADSTTIKEQLTLAVTVLRRVLPSEEQQ